MKIVRFQRHLPLTIQFYISCRILGVPPLQSDFYGLSSALKDDTNEPKKRKETRTKPTKMARKKSTLRMTRTTTDKLPTCDYYYKLARRLPAPSPGPALLTAAAGASVYLEPVLSMQHIRPAQLRALLDTNRTPSISMSVNIFALFCNSLSHRRLVSFPFDSE